MNRKFIYHVENAFKVQGIRIESLTLAPRASLSAVIERQIKEGVLAIIKLSRNHEFSGKIPLQLIDRGGGPDNARFTGMLFLSSDEPVSSLLTNMAQITRKWT